MKNKISEHEMWTWRETRIPGTTIHGRAFETPSQEKKAPAECLKIRGMIEATSSSSLSAKFDLEQIKAVIAEWCRDNGGVLTVDMIVSFYFLITKLLYFEFCIT